MSDLPPVVVARVLGHALRVSSSCESRNVLARDIIDCNAYPTDHPELLAGLAHLYVFTVIRLLYSDPSSLQPQEANSFGIPYLESKVFLSRRRKFSERSYEFLIDDFGSSARAVYERFVPDLDSRWSSLRFNWQLGLQALDPPRRNWPEATGDLGLTDASRKKWGSAYSVWLSKLLALTTVRTWFYPTDTYDVHVPESILGGRSIEILGIKRRIVFKSASLSDGTVVSPPHPKILAHHAACAQVANLSGAAEYVEDLYDDDPDGIALMTEPKASTELSQKTEEVAAHLLSYMICRFDF
ncbi:hypothetical protein BKA70DRAFT_1405226 [Coprinopsis sp. MPI-PUGE-AT-0042]|nr:hypothetical protein BKA70DRAFT_1405226 [Coprinopsis sp. MPI-PUGE-AT-0042]